MWMCDSSVEGFWDCLRSGVGEGVERLMRENEGGKGLVVGRKGGIEGEEDKIREEYWYLGVMIGLCIKHGVGLKDLHIHPNVYKVFSGVKLGRKDLFDKDERACLVGDVMGQLDNLGVKEGKVGGGGAEDGEKGEVEKLLGDVRFGLSDGSSLLHYQGGRSVSTVSSCKLYGGLLRRHVLMSDWEEIQGLYDGITAVVQGKGLAMLDWREWGELVRGEWRD